MKKRLSGVLAVLLLFFGLVGFTGCDKLAKKEFVFNDLQVTVIASVFDGSVATTETLPVRQFILRQMGISETETLSPEMEEILTEEVNDYISSFVNIVVKFNSKNGGIIFNKTNPDELTGEYYESEMPFKYFVEENKINVGIIFNEYGSVYTEYSVGSFDGEILKFNMWNDYDEYDYFDERDVGSILYDTIVLVQK